jgi:hypothetical protein
MSKGHEFLHRLHEVIAEFEAAIVRREHKKALLDNPVVLQQDVDAARQKLVKTMIGLAREASQEYTEKK